MSLVAQYRMDEKTGTAIKDSFGTNHGTWAGTAAQAITVVNAPLSSGLTFDGGTPGDDAITVGADTLIDINGKSVYSISAWINPASDGEGNYGRIVSKVDATASTTGYSFYVGDEAASFVKFGLLIQHATTDGSAYSNAAVVPINTWSHVVATYNEDGDGKSKLYLNGTLLALGTDTAGDTAGSPSDDSADDLVIGNSVDLDRTFDGSITNIMIFDHALTAFEVKRLYSNGAGTDIASDLDPKIRTRRLETANMPTRIRY